MDVKEVFLEKVKALCNEEIKNRTEPKTTLEDLFIGSVSMSGLINKIEKLNSEILTPANFTEKDIDEIREVVAEMVKNVLRNRIIS